MNSKHFCFVFYNFHFNLVQVLVIVSHGFIIFICFYFYLFSYLVKLSAELDISYNFINSKYRIFEWF